MSIVRSGATKKYADNWEDIFGGKRSGKKSATATPAKKKSAGKKSAKKKVAKTKAKAGKSGSKQKAGRK
jgi:hypothetical protein